MTYSLKELAQTLACEFRGDGSGKIDSISEIQTAGKGSITFIGNGKYTKFADNSEAAAIIISKNMDISFPNVIFADDPQAVFAKLIPMFIKGRGLQKREIHSTAVIDETAVLGKDIHVGAHVSIGPHTIIGDDVTIYANVSIYDHCKIGDNTIIHSGTVIGSDGFGFTFHNDHYEKIPQLGRVIIGKNVEFGANCAVDRGTIGDTEIGDGCKFDNHVHVAHNVRIGKHCVFAGQTGVAGSTRVDDFCVFGGQVAINGHVHIGSGTQAAARSGITKDIIPGEVVGGFPAIPIKDYHKREINIRRIPDILEKLKQASKSKEK